MTQALDYIRTVEVSISRLLGMELSDWLRRKIRL